MGIPRSRRKDKSTNHYNTEGANCSVISESITSKSLRQQILDHPNIPLENKKQALELLEIGVAPAYKYVLRLCGIKLKIERLTAQSFDRNSVQDWKKVVKAALLIHYRKAVEFKEIIQENGVLFKPQPMNNNNPVLIPTKELLFNPSAKKRLLELSAIYYLNTAVDPKNCHIFLCTETGRVDIRA